MTKDRRRLLLLLLLLLPLVGTTCTEQFLHQKFIPTPYRYRPGCAAVLAVAVFGDDRLRYRYQRCPARPRSPRPLDVPGGAGTARRLPPLLPLEAGLLQQLRLAVGYPRDGAKSRGRGGGGPGSSGRRTGTSNNACRGSRAGRGRDAAAPGHPATGGAAGAAAASAAQVLRPADAVVAVEHDTRCAVKSSRKQSARNGHDGMME